jgi:hypothetical protein
MPLTHRRRFTTVNSLVRAARDSVLFAAACCVLTTCGGNPNEPRPGPLASARWTGGGACLSVADTGCNLTVGCGHGQFPRPTIRDDGTFDVDGSYRIEVGPVSVDPPPPAHFRGSLLGSTLTVTVVPTNGLPTATYVLTPSSSNGTSCGVACV